MGVTASESEEEIQTPPRKRLRQDAQQTKSSKERLFVPFRALGLVTNHVPFVLQTRSFKGATEGPRIHILTCLGRSWALWEGGKMTLLFVGKQTCMQPSVHIDGVSTSFPGPSTPDPISSLAMDGNAVWAAVGPHALKYIRGREAGT